MKIIPYLLLSFFALSLVPSNHAAEKALIHFTGAEFKGGAKHIYGTAYENEQVNTVYAESAGPLSRMQLDFQLESLPNPPLFVHLKARDDESPRQCAIAIELNGKTLFAGTNQFSSKNFETRKFPIPNGALKEGGNTLVISCREKEGRSGVPPWFQVADCVIAPENFVVQQDLLKTFHITLPAEKKPFPEPLAPGAQPGFKFRGTKGWAWTPEQYLAEIPYLAKFKMNFLMNCYISMFDIEHYNGHYKWNDGKANRWWEDFSPEKKKAYEEVVRECQKRGIEFCFSMNPNFCSTRLVNDDSAESVEQLYKHYAWMQSLGVKWFNISLDDAAEGVNASTQSKVVNLIFHRLRAKDPEAQMIFCPTFYWGDGTAKNQMNLGMDQQPYLETLGRELDKDVFMYWTGEDVIGKNVTRKSAEKVRRISGHRLFLWDNYPVNDDQPAMHLGPLTGREADLCEVVDGYISNPMCKQNQLNRLPLATCADYSYNPRAYDPARSIGQAILLLADTTPQREVLRDLIEVYPGFIISSDRIGSNAASTGSNAAQEQFGRILVLPYSRQAALGYIEHLENLSERFKEAFPNNFQAEKETLNNDIRLASEKLAQRYP